MDPVTVVEEVAAVEEVRSEGSSEVMGVAVAGKEESRAASSKKRWEGSGRQIFYRGRCFTQPITTSRTP
uniref:Uncharacterized protein n=1 Tax=Arundo donax TaxID=35708 RepID=A0A0A9BGT3_ARUDO